MSLFSSFDDYRRVRLGMQTYQRFELVSDAANAVVAERLPASRVIAANAPDPKRIEALRQARAETDRRLEFVATKLIPEPGSPADAIYILNELRAELVSGRQLVDAFILIDPARRPSRDFRNAMDAMFSAASLGDSLRDTFGQSVISVAPEVSIEVFLGLSVGSLRDQAGRLGSLVMLAWREKGADRTTLDRIQTVVGRLGAANRILQTLAHALPAGSRVEAQLEDVQLHFFSSAVSTALGMAAEAPTGHATYERDFPVRFDRGLEAIDGLLNAISGSSRGRLRAVADGAYGRARIAALLTGIVCLILVVTIQVFRRALFVPLGRAREQTIAIARGDLSEPIAEKRAVGEVGEMLASLHAIRDDQRWRRELEEQQAEMARRLKHLSETDMLTGLLNRRAVEERARQVFREADEETESLAAILFDVDHFKSINDRFGHAIGDDVLRKIASETLPLIRVQDHFARFGGEEFIVLLPRIEIEEAREIAAAICARIPVIVRLPDGGRVTASFGLALRECETGVSWEELVATADRRLYAAKHAGRNRVCESDPPDVSAVA